MMAESTASVESQHHSQVPVAKPRRSRSKSAIQSSGHDPEQDPMRSLQDNTKPERPSVPPRPNFSELKKVATRTPHSSTLHSQISPSSPKQRQIPTEKSSAAGSHRSISGSNSANALIYQRRQREQLQHIRSRSNSESADSERSNGTLTKQRQALSNKVSDSGRQGNKSTKSTFSAARVSHSKSFSSPERKRNTNTITSTSRASAQQQQSPTRPRPPLPANRPSTAPSAASSKGSSSPTKQNQRPSRPPTLPKTAATLNTSKTAPLSHLYGSTQSLPAATDGTAGRVPATPKYFDDSSESTKLINGPLATAGSGRRLLKVSPNKGPQRSYRTLPKDYGKKSATQEPQRLHTSPRGTVSSDTPQTQGKRVAPPASTASTKFRGLGGRNNQPVALARKTQPQHSKTLPKRTPPKRPPPVVRDKPHFAVVTKTPHTPPSVDDSTSNPRYATFTNRVQQQQLIEDHIYMAPHQTDASSWPAEGGGTGAEYPYVIMSRSDSAHIYTPLALDTTDDLEDYDMVILGTDLQESLTVSVTELDNDVQFSVNNEDTHQYENSASLQPENAVPEPESPVYNNECLQLQEDNGPSLDQQTTDRDDNPELTIESEGVMTAEDSEGGQPADQQKEEDVSSPDSMTSQQQDVQLHGTCSSQSVPQLHVDNQQTESVAPLDDQDSQQSPATELELKDSQQSEQLEGDLLERDQAAETSDEVIQEAAWPKKGEEFQENQIDRELKEIPYQEMGPEEDSNNNPLAAAAENHTAHPEGYQQEPQSAELRVKSIGGTETKEECQQQSKSNQPLSINSPTELGIFKQPAAEYSQCTEGDSREVMDSATPTTQALDSPVDQELPDYYNVDAINNMHMDGLTV